MRVGLIFLFLAVPAVALDLMELRDGKLIPVEEATRQGDRLLVKLALKENGKATVTYPIDLVLPEFVFYVWARDLPEHDQAANLELAIWSRKNGLFSLARKVYEETATFDEGIRKELPSIVKQLHEEEATWLFGAAESSYRNDELADASVDVERLLSEFLDTEEFGRAQELRKMIGERTKALGEERRKQDAARRLRRQRIEVRTQAARIAQGRAYADAANLRYVAYARWRLNWACCLYEGAARSLEDLLPYVEDESLREEIQRRMDEAASRSVAAYLRLADLRYLAGDLGAALDAAHRVLDLDPANAAATGIRDRILDGPGPTHIRYDGGFLTFRQRFDGIGGFGFWRGIR